MNISEIIDILLTDYIGQRHKEESNHMLCETDSAIHSPR